MSNRDKNDDLESYLDEGEGTHVEFKAHLPSSVRVARALVAFANTRGGTLVVGVHDDRSVLGVRVPSISLERIARVAGFECEPPIEYEARIVEHRGLKVLLIDVPESEEKPHRVLGLPKDRSVFVRVGATTRIASKSVIKNLGKGRPSPVLDKLDPNAIKLLVYLETHEKITIRQFMRLVNISKRRAMRILTTLNGVGLVREHCLESENYYTRG